MFEKHVELLKFDEVWRKNTRHKDLCPRRTKDWKGGEVEGEERVKIGGWYYRISHIFSLLILTSMTNEINGGNRAH